MEVQKAYDLWSDQYDSNENKTRDLEAKVKRSLLQQFRFETCLEIGCGTGKNTEWLAKKAKEVKAVDLSEEMLAKAKQKVTSNNVDFIQTDINEEWTFADRQYDLITFSLVLEHIEDLDQIFKKAAAALRPGGLMYVGELHPFKQYLGSKARFDLNNETIAVNSYTHHITDYMMAMRSNGLELIKFSEEFDDGGDIPRLIVMVFCLA